MGLADRLFRRFGFLPRQCSASQISLWLLLVSLLIVCTLNCERWFALGQVADSDTFFACQANHELQLKDQAVRCFQPAQTRYQAPIGCQELANKAFLAIDHRKNQDVCLVDTETLPLRCNAGYTLQIRTGLDRCSQHQEAQSHAPAIPISQTLPITYPGIDAQDARFADVQAQSLLTETTSQGFKV